MGGGVENCRFITVSVSRVIRQSPELPYRDLVEVCEVRDEEFGLVNMDARVKKTWVPVLVLL